MRVQFKRILCATDFSDFSNRAIPYGIALAREFKAHLFVQHVIAYAVSAGYGEVIVDLAEYQNKAMEYAHEQIVQIVGRLEAVQKRRPHVT